MSDEQAVATQGEMTLLTVALICVILSVLSTDAVPALVFAFGSVLLCLAERMCLRKRTGRWSR